MSSVSEQRKVEVLRLHYAEGESIRGIARKLSMSKRAVRTLLGIGRPKPRSSPAPRSSILAPYEKLVVSELAQTPEMRAPTMLEQLRVAGYTGGISVLRDLMKRVRPRPLLDVYSGFDTRPGERLEVDWGDMGFAIPGLLRRVSIFVAMLVYSRMLYIDFALSQQMGSFLRCLERALTFFGGRTAVDVFDNMKTVVLGRVGNLPEFHPRFVDYARIRGFSISATRPRRPTDKPFVERGIGFVRSRFLPGRRFADFQDLRSQGIPSASGAPVSLLRCSRPSHRRQRAALFVTHGRSSSRGRSDRVAAWSKARCSRGCASSRRCTLGRSSRGSARRRS
ncbi:MAG: IS21 family transposase, partial [Deltaproteobacteria bacterium]|nr:IS21 family transposase [Deltaproteobacteria bacterium]